jgi:hypothetical protein
MQVGPFRLEVVEAMRRARVVLDDNATGLACDLLFSARTAAIQEGRQTFRSGTRTMMDATRFAQFGRWSGTIRHPDGELGLDAATCLGTKDRSWGVRPVGEREVGGAPVMPGGFFFLWAPLVWPDHVSHAIFFDGPQGEARHHEGIIAPLYQSEDAVAATEDDRTRHMARVAHRVRYVRGTRLAAAAEIDLVDLGGETRKITLQPRLKFQMKGLGYLHPVWGQGVWRGELEIGGESFDPASLDPLAPENLHVQQVVTASDGRQTGTGVLEQLSIGPHAPSGFKEFLDGAR